MSPIQRISGQPLNNGHDTGTERQHPDPSADRSPGYTNGGRNGTSVAGHDASSRHDRVDSEDRIAQALLDSLAQGNSCAFWELWGLYRTHLYQICLSHMVGVREDAEDALSRSMLRALDKLTHIGPQIENVRAWLSRLTVNLCVDMHRERRRRARRLELIDDVLPNLGESSSGSADSPEDAFLNREAYTCVCHAVNNLPNRLREPFALRFFQEMAYVDIAERLMLSNENVRKRIQQARDILKQRLDDDGVAELRGDRVDSRPLQCRRRVALPAPARASAKRVAITTCSQTEPHERLS